MDSKRSDTVAPPEGSGDAPSPQGERDALVAFSISPFGPGRARDDDGVAATAKRRGVASTMRRSGQVMIERFRS